MPAMQFRNFWLKVVGTWTVKAHDAKSRFIPGTATLRFVFTKKRCNFCKTNGAFKAQFTMGRFQTFWPNGAKSRKKIRALFMNKRFGNCSRRATMRIV